MLKTFGGADLLRPNRHRVLALGLPMGRVTSCSSLNGMYGSTCILRTKRCTVCVNAGMESTTGVSFACMMGRSAMARRLDQGTTPCRLRGHVLTSNSCRRLPRHRCIRRRKLPERSGCTVNLPYPSAEKRGKVSFLSFLSSGKIRFSSMTSNGVALSRFVSVLALSSYVGLLNKRPGAKYTGAFKVKGLPRCKIPGIVATSKPTKLHVLPGYKIGAAT